MAVIACGEGSPMGALFLGSTGLEAIAESVVSSTAGKLADGRRPPAHVSISLATGSMMSDIGDTHGGDDLALMSSVKSFQNRERTLPKHRQVGGVYYSNRKQFNTALQHA